MPCQECGEVIQARRRNRRFCDGCKANREAARKKAAKVPKGRTVPLTCERCGNTWTSVKNNGRWCPECRPIIQKERIKAYTSIPEVRKARAVYMKERGYARKAQLAQYGLTVEDFDRMLAEQGGVCAICSREHERMCVDHCHETGKVRGILCSPCNRAIGQLGDTVEHVQRAVTYLMRTSHN
jgi:hypothetical protein